MHSYIRHMSAKSIDNLSALMVDKKLIHNEIVVNPLSVTSGSYICVLLLLLIWVFMSIYALQKDCYQLKIDYNNTYRKLSKKWKVHAKIHKRTII